MNEISNFLIQYGYWGFFIASFLSATVLPFSSELILIALLDFGASPSLCLFWGTIGNTLGGLTCYWLGSFGKTEWIIKYLRMPEDRVASLKVWVDKYGSFMAFFSFLPIVGDMINVALGLLHVDIKWVTIFMCIGKFFRYLLWMIFNHYVILPLL